MLEWVTVVLRCSLLWPHPWSGTGKSWKIHYAITPTKRPRCAPDRLCQGEKEKIWLRRALYRNEVHSSRGSIIQQQEQGAWVPLTDSWGRGPGWGDTWQEPIIYFQVKYSLSPKKLIGDLLCVSDKWTDKLNWPCWTRVQVTFLKLGFRLDVLWVVVAVLVSDHTATPEIIALSWRQLVTCKHQTNQGA